MSSRRKEDWQALGIDPAALSFHPRKGGRVAWSFDAHTFEPEFFDPDADGVYAPRPHGWPGTLMEARRRALDDLKIKRRDLARAIRTLEKAIVAEDAG